MNKIKKLLIKIMFIPIWLIVILMFIGFMIVCIFDKYFAIAFDTEPNYNIDFKDYIKSGAKEIFKYWII
jgi:hypothetical protein